MPLRTNKYLDTPFWYLPILGDLRKNQDVALPPSKRRKQPGWDRECNDSISPVVHNLHEARRWYRERPLFALERGRVGCCFVERPSVCEPCHAQLTVNQTNINFGSIPAGSSSSQALVLSNSGGSSVKISQATVTGPGFSLGSMPLPLTLATGQTATSALATCHSLPALQTAACP